MLAFRRLCGRWGTRVAVAVQMYIRVWQNTPFGMLEEIRLSHYLQGFIHPRWLAGFLNHQQYCIIQSMVQPTYQHISSSLSLWRLQVWERQQDTFRTLEFRWFNWLPSCVFQSIFGGWFLNLTKIGFRCSFFVPLFVFILISKVIYTHVFPAPGPLYTYKYIYIYIQSHHMRILGTLVNNKIRWLQVNQFGGVLNMHCRFRII